MCTIKEHKVLNFFKYWNKWNINIVLSLGLSFSLTRHSAFSGILETYEYFCAWVKHTTLMMPLGHCSCSWSGPVGISRGSNQVSCMENSQIWQSSLSILLSHPVSSFRAVNWEEAAKLPFLESLKPWRSPSLCSSNWYHVSQAASESSAVLKSRHLSTGVIIRGRQASLHWSHWQ